MKLLSLSIVLLAGVLSGCNDAPKANDAQNTLPAPPPASLTPPPQANQNAVLTQDYQCMPAQRIQAIYDNTDPQKPSVSLTINGTTYPMYSIVTASGAGYATEQGIHDGQGMKWLSKGDSALLVSMTMDHTAKPEDEKTLFECQLTQSQHENPTPSPR